MSVTPRVPGANRPHFMDDLAIQKAAAKDWFPFAYEAVGDKETGGVLIIGGVPVKHVSRGPNKGRPRWDRKKATRVFVLSVEIRQAEADYETQTGNCHNCGGGGQEWAGWSAKEGTKYRRCQRCNGTGEKP